MDTCPLHHRARLSFFGARVTGGFTQPCSLVASVSSDAHSVLFVTSTYAAIRDCRIRPLHTPLMQMSCVQTLPSEQFEFSSTHCLFSQTSHVAQRALRVVIVVRADSSRANANPTLAFIGTQGAVIDALLVLADIAFAQRALRVVIVVRADSSRANANPTLAFIGTQGAVIDALLVLADIAFA